MTSQWQITATLFETGSELRVAFLATRETPTGTETTADQVLAANLADAHAECRNYMRALGVERYTFVDKTSAAA